MTIKTFRGLIADGGIDTIVLHTNDGSMGYRIVKFELMPEKPGDDQYESIVKIYKTPQTTATAVIDFSDQTLLAASIWNSGNVASDNLWMPLTSIFDREIFNQDIYITHQETDSATATSVNYYMELEQVKLDLSENTVATLKDIRNAARVPLG